MYIYVPPLGPGAGIATSTLAGPGSSTTVYKSRLISLKDTGKLYHRNNMYAYKG